MKRRSAFNVNIIRDTSGFSVAELILALVLLLIALGLGYNLMYFTRTSFDRSEQRWMEQNEVVAISNLIYDSLNESFYVEVADDIDSILLPNTDFYGAFYIDGNGDTMYRHSDGSSIKDVELPGDNLDLLFSKELYMFGETESEYFNLLNLSVTSDELDYNLTTQVHLDNMNRDRPIAGLASGSVVVFKTREIVETVPEDLYDDLCFIATAAYETPMNPSVRLLRRFRDEVLLKTRLGTNFVEFYYKNSPPLASAIAKSSILRFMTRAVLYPVVGLISLIMSPLHFLCVMAGVFLAMVYIKKRFRPAGERNLN